VQQAEKILIENVKHSDKDSFKKLYLQYHPVLFRFVVSRVHDEDIAEDIVQDTFVRVWEIRQSLASDKSFFSLIAKVSSNLSKDHFKHEAVRLRHKENITEIYDRQSDKPDKQLETEFIKKNILNIIHQYLPLKQRTIFLLSRIEGKSNEEIAEMLGISQRTVENQLYRALKTLKKKIKRIV
jgi:RNA polymerase sigma-70 factor (ECF subfamily)